MRPARVVRRGWRGGKDLVDLSKDGNNTTAEGDSARVKEECVLMIERELRG